MAQQSSLKRSHSRGSKSTKPSLEDHQSSLYDDCVFEIEPLADRLRNELLRRVRTEPEWAKLNRQLIDAITDTCVSVVQQAQPEDKHVIDPISGLRLPPPPPEMLYKDRKQNPALRTMTPEQFISATFWAKYRDAGLLTSDFIRRGDGSLYTALGNRARYKGILMTDLLRECGVLSRLDIANPSPERFRQMSLIYAARMKSSRVPSEDSPDGR